MMLKFVVLAAASFCASVLAQSAPQLNFIPPNITAGNTYTLTWSGGDSSAVALTLMNGPSDNLLQVGTIAQNIQGSVYTWTTDNTMYNGNNYAIMITQGSQFSISPQFAISGGATPPATTSASSTSSASTTSATSRATESASQSSASPNSTLAPLNGNASNGTTAGGSRKKTKLGKGEIVGIVIGVVAIFAALATFGIFVIASTALSKKGPPSTAGEEPDNAGVAPLTQRPGSSRASASRSLTPVAHYVKRKAVGGSDEEMSVQGDGSSSSSPRKYRSSLDSPATLVPTPARRFGDVESSSITTSRVPSILSGPTSPNGQWDDRGGYAVSAPNAVAHAYHPGRPLSNTQPGYLVPQYTGDTMISGRHGITPIITNNGSNRQPMMSMVNTPELAPMWPQLTGDTMTPGMGVRPQQSGESMGAGPSSRPQSTENSRNGKERRPSQSNLTGQSKLRQEVE